MKLVFDDPAEEARWRQFAEDYEAIQTEYANFLLDCLIDGWPPVTDDDEDEDEA